MILNDGGPGFPYPMGDPGTIDSAAAGLHQAATQLTTAAGQISSAASSVSAYWSGVAYVSFESAVSSTQQGLRSLAQSHTDAADALTTYATALRQAQTDADNAATTYSHAEQHYTETLNSLSSNPPTGKGAQSTINSTVTTANGTLNQAYTSSYHACTTAVTTATNAAKACASKLEGIASDVQDTALHKFLDLMGGPGTVFGTLGVTLQAKSGLATWNLLKAMNTGDYKALEEADPQGWAKVEQIAAKYGEDSPEALKAQVTFEAEAADDAFGDMVNAAIGVNKVPAGLGPGAFDVLGKIGVVAGVASDVLTLADGQAPGRDKAAAVVNLAGMGMAATGTDLASAAVTALVGESAAAAIPVVGEVLIAGTALYFGTEWVSQHWDQIKQWGADIGDGLDTAYHAVGAAYGWANHEVTSGLADAGHLLSDLNPF